MSRFEKHLFVCTNERTNGKKCCGAEHGAALIRRLKDLLDRDGMRGKVRINRAGCLDSCAYGSSLVVYPEAVWYGNLSLEDVDQIWDEHVLGDQIVERLRIDFDVPARRWLRQFEGE